MQNSSTTANLVSIVLAPCRFTVLLYLVFPDIGLSQHVQSTVLKTPAVIMLFVHVLFLEQLI